MSETIVQYGPDLVAQDPDLIRIQNKDSHDRTAFIIPPEGERVLVNGTKVQEP